MPHYAASNRNLGLFFSDDAARPVVAITPVTPAKVAVEHDVIRLDPLPKKQPPPGENDALLAWLDQAWQKMKALAEAEKARAEEDRRIDNLANKIGVLNALIPIVSEAMRAELIDIKCHLEAGHGSRT